jgi:hypothetical protein
MGINPSSYHSRDAMTSHTVVTAFCSGLRHGQGLLVYASGTKYEGAFINDAMEGVGILSGAYPLPQSWSRAPQKYSSQHYCLNHAGKDGSVYKGSFKDNALSGRGIYQSTDGSVYDGQVSCISAIESASPSSFPFKSLNYCHCRWSTLFVSLRTTTARAMAS